MENGIPSLEAQGSRILIQLTPECGGTLRVCENQTHRWMDFGTPFTQSLMSLADPASLELQYTKAMALTGAFSPNAQRLLNLGMGCGAFERFFCKYFPSIALESIESEKSIIGIAKEYFAVPSTPPVQLSNAEDAIQASCSQFDIVLCDLHNGSEHPSCLIDGYFYRSLDEHMTSDGVLAINLLPASEQELISVLQAVRSVFNWQYLLEFDNIGNVLIFAFKKQPAGKPEVISKAHDLGEKTRTDFSPFANQLKLLPVAR